MRDIRGDLRERANLLEEQIKAAQAQFDKYVEQLKGEHAGRLIDLKSELDAVNTIMGIEHRRHGGTQSVPKAQPQPQPQPQGPKPQRPLSDLLMRRAV